MAQVTPPSSQGSSYWTYLNPFRLATAIWGTVATLWAFRAKEEDRAVLYVHGKDGTLVQRMKNLLTYRDRRAHGYEGQMKILLGNGVTLTACRQFFSDLACSRGLPERLFLDGELIANPPRSGAWQKLLLEELLERAEGNPQTVSRWTNFWNQAWKSDLLEDVRRKYIKKYGGSPFISDESLTKMDIFLDTKTEKVTCVVEGTIEKEIDGKVINPTKSFKASLTIDLKEEVIEKSIEVLKVQASGGG